MKATLLFLVLATAAHADPQPLPTRWRSESINSPGRQTSATIRDTSTDEPISGVNYTGRYAPAPAVWQVSSPTSYIVTNELVPWHPGIDFDNNDSPGFEYAGTIGEGEHLLMIGNLLSWKNDDHPWGVEYIYEGTGALHYWGRDPSKGPGRHVGNEIPRIGETAGYLGIAVLDDSEDAWGRFDFRPILAGDFNKDDVVDFADFLILAANYDTPTPDGSERPEQGDFNRDTLIQFDDFLGFAARYGDTRADLYPDPIVQPSAAGATAAIPEPSTVLLVSLAGLGFLSVARHRSTDSPRHAS